MSMREYNRLLAELAEIDRLIEILPDSAVIDRTSWESRRLYVQDELDRFPLPARWPLKARLTFNGKPVVDRHGIAADFGTDAVKAFSDAVAAVGAGQRSELGQRGIIPNREDFQLFITGIVHGSFGFVIEEAQTQESQTTFIPIESPVEVAVERIRTILAASIGGSEDLADAIVETQHRALESLRGFLKIMAENEAVCSLAFRDNVFRFMDVGQVWRSHENLSSDNIVESEYSIPGRFQGYLPVRRRAEFITDESDDVIYGIVDSMVDNATHINEVLNRHVDITVRATTVGGGRPRYVIIGFETPQ